MRIDRAQALILRRQGKSYNDIKRILGVPKSTLSDWFGNNLWSQEIKAHLVRKAQVNARGNLRRMSLANKAKWERWHQQCRDEARKEFPSLKSEPLFLAGLMLYWGEGDKVLKNGSVRLSNSDPEMINLFYSFLLRLGTPKDKITAHLILYPDLSEKTCRSYWGKILTVPSSQFRKSSVIVGKHPNRRLSYGVCILCVSSRELKEKIMTWIYLFSDFLQNNSILRYNVAG